jgi:hypothetical protein
MFKEEGEAKNVRRNINTPLLKFFPQKNDNEEERMLLRL